MEVQYNAKDEWSASTGGVYQLHHGHSRRIALRISPLIEQNTPDGLSTGALPLLMDSVQFVSAGCVLVRHKGAQTTAQAQTTLVKDVQSPLDSYHEADLVLLRSRWEHAIDIRKVHIDDELRRIDENMHSGIDKSSGICLNY